MARPQKSAISARHKRLIKFLICDDGKLKAIDKQGETIHLTNYATQEGAMLLRMFEKKPFCKVGKIIVKSK